MTIYLDSDFYNEHAIKKAIKDYHNIANIQYAKDGNGFTCQIADAIADIELVSREFINYILDLSVGRADII